MDDRLKRHDLSEEEWQRLLPLLPVNPRQGGRWADHRLVINGVFFRTRTGSPWRVYAPPPCLPSCGVFVVSLQPPTPERAAETCARGVGARFVGTDSIEVEHIVLNGRPRLRVFWAGDWNRYVIAYCKTVAELREHVDLADLVEVVYLANRRKSS
ncbi:transposase [Sphaerisporangium viridialbum]|uniref:transposase n=1 Tax=Sphaerisporangium viridialbum TaxID=46189 RepID=UPI003C735AF1